MTVKEKIEAGIDQTLLLAGDSLAPEEPWGWIYRTAQLLAAKYPNAKVRIKMRSFDVSLPDGPWVTIQAGNGGPTISIIRDGVPGATSLQMTMAPRYTRLFSESPIDGFFLLIGTNDFLQSYDSNSYIDNLVYLGNSAKQNFGADVCLITPAWYGNYLNIGIAGFASLCRLAASRCGFKCVDASKVFQQHYQLGNGLYGQGDWFANTNSDAIHFDRNGHYAIADEVMRVNFT